MEEDFSRRITVWDESKDVFGETYYFTGCYYKSNKMAVEGNKVIAEEVMISRPGKRNLRISDGKAQKLTWENLIDVNLNEKLSKGVGDLIYDFIQSTDKECLITNNNDKFNIDNIDGVDLRWELMWYLISISQERRDDQIVKASDYKWTKLVDFSKLIVNALEEERYEDYRKYLDALWFMEFGRSRKIEKYLKKGLSWFGLCEQLRPTVDRILDNWGEGSFKDGIYRGRYIMPLTYEVGRICSFLGKGINKDGALVIMKQAFGINTNMEWSELLMQMWIEASWFEKFMMYDYTKNRSKYCRKDLDEEEAVV
jgi:hypothetical protein